MQTVSPLMLLFTASLVSLHPLPIRAWPSSVQWQTVCKVRADENIYDDNTYLFTWKRVSPSLKKALI